MATEVSNYTDHHYGSSSVERRITGSAPGSGAALGSADYDLSESNGFTRETSPNQNFLSKIKDGEIVIGPYETSGVKNTSYIGSSGVVGFAAGGSYTDYVTFVNAPLIEKTSVMTALGSYTINVDDHKVIAATQAEANMLSGAAQTAVAFVERYKTLSLLATSAHRLISVFRAARSSIRRGSGLRELKELLRDLSFDDAMNAWMEYRYGWRPLLYDISQHQRALADILSDSGQYWKSRGTSDFHDTTVVSGVDLGSVSITAGPGGVVGRGDVRAFPRRVGSIAGFFYKIDQSAINPSLYWLGFQSPTAVIWELVPYSFVIDWFVNLGDYLTSLSTFPAFIRDPRGFLSTSQTWIVSASTTSFYYYTHTPTVDLLQPSSASWEVWNFTREIISPGEHAGLRFNVNLSLSKLIDLFALARNLAGSNKSEAIRKLRV